MSLPLLKACLPTSHLLHNLHCPEGLKGIIRAPPPLHAFWNLSQITSGVPLPSPRGQHSWLHLGPASHGVPAHRDKSHIWDRLVKPILHVAQSSSCLLRLDFNLGIKHLRQCRAYFKFPGRADGSQDSLGVSEILQRDLTPLSQGQQEPPFLKTSTQRMQTSVSGSWQGADQRDVPI